MKSVSGVQSSVSKPEKFEKGGWKTGRILDGFGKYVFDLALNFPPKSHLGRRRLHKTVQEEINGQSSLTPRNSGQKNLSVLREKDKQNKIDEIQEEMSNVKHKIEVSSAKMEPVSSNKSPPEKLKDKDFLLPNKKRIMIRSRL